MGFVLPGHVKCIFTSSPLGQIQTNPASVLKTKDCMWNTTDRMLGI